MHILVYIGLEYGKNKTHNNEELGVICFYVALFLHRLFCRQIQQIYESKHLTQLSHIRCIRYNFNLSLEDMFYII